MSVFKSVASSIDGLMRERDQANELVVDLLDMLRAAVLDRLMIDNDAEFAAMILSGQSALPSGYPDWMAAAVTQISSYAATRSR